MGNTERVGTPGCAKRLGAPAVAAVSVCVVLFGAHAKGASWSAAAGLALVLGLGVLLSIRHGTPTTREEVGRGLVVGAVIAMSIGWIQLDSNTRLRQADAAHQDEGARRDLQLLLSRQNDLAGAPLDHRDLSRFLLSKKNFTRAHLRESVLRGTDLRGASMRRADLAFADLRGADLSPAGPVTFPFPVKLLAAPTRIVDHYLNRPPVRALDATDLRGVVLRWADLRHADLRWVRLDRDPQRRRLDPTTIDLVAADLTNADLRGARLNGATLQGADLTWADLRGTRLGRPRRIYGRPPCEPVWCANRPAAVGHEREIARRRAVSESRRNVEFNGYQVAPVFVGASLIGARLDGASLVRGDFRGASLRLAVLRGADLRRADLRFSDLRGADLRATRFDRGRFKGAAWDRSTQWPNNFSARRRTGRRPGQDPAPVPQGDFYAPTVPSGSSYPRIGRSVTKRSSR
jgi:uncharacterized protein YjbI with pentapeptide repeats